MQWDGSRGRGFTTGEPWLPFGPLHPNVAQQRSDPDSLLSLYRRAIRLRKATPALREGSYRELSVEDGFWTYERALDGSRLTVGINTGSLPYEWRLPAPGTVVLATERSLEGAEVVSKLTVPALGAVVLQSGAS
jgi:alpha-glucosidase